MVTETKNPLMSFGEAIELAKRGTPIASVGMKSYEFICLTKPCEVETKNLWAYANQIAAAKNGGKLNVRGYFLRTDTSSTVPHVFSNVDIFNEWMEADYQVRPTNIVYTIDVDGLVFATDSENPRAGYVVEYGLIQEGSTEHHVAPLWLLFEELNWDVNPFVYICGENPTMLPTIVDNIRETYKYRGNSGMSVGLYEDQPEPNINKIVLNPEHSLAEVRKLIEANADKHFDYTNFIIDTDSFNNNETIIDYITNTITDLAKSKDHHWACISLNEQVS